MTTSNLRECPITGLFVIKSDSFGAMNNSGSHEMKYVYSIMIRGHEQKLIVPFDYSSWLDDSFFLSNKHIIAGLLLTEQLFKFSESYVELSLEYIKHKFEEATFPRTPNEKYDNLLYKLFSFQEYEGQSIDMRDKVKKDIFYTFFFKNTDELLFYIKTLENDGLLKVKMTGNVNYGMEILDSCNLTYKGLSYALKLMDEGKQSKNCFIAMSFGNEMSDIRRAIKEACLETGYVPVLVDEVHYDSDTTINDAIIANLRKSRFCIADFTEQKDGVYFESGFALGQGKQVIYSCQKDWFIKSRNP